MPLVEGPESNISPIKVDEDAPEVQQLPSLITRSEVLRGVVGHDQKPVALADSFCVDGKGRLVVALAACKERNRNSEAFRVFHYASAVRRLNERTITVLG
ncbi:hypothetical protein [Streptomyces sp. NBC_00846]|uniref:hypothetical protein n=1 Tax=Streptomyces sp. NBC_00846 TaxID=2975849 RepID=UPI003866D53F